MKRKTRLPELLAPAGSEEALYAAVAAGADAVYLGGKRFGARAFAENFELREIERAVRYCHLHGVRVYVTVNTMTYERELPEAVAFCRALAGIGTDGVIVSDMGLARRLRREVPSLPQHASTQMSLHNAEGVRIAAKLGCTRAVVSRELSLADIRKTVESSPLEIEVFLHGALCVSYSGQCLFSSLVGGRSGNRGECAQPCRLPYGKGEKYPLSLKDLCAASHIRELIASGVASLKIEGRMKSADYVYAVTKIYRRLLDEGRDATDGELLELRRVFSRGGFTDGYLTGKKQGMMGVRTEEDKADTRAVKKQVFSPIRHPVRARACFALGKPSYLEITDGAHTVSAEGEIPAAALNSPLKIDDLSTKLCKMGATFLSLEKKDLEIELEDGVNLPPSAINALRRDAAERFELLVRGGEASDDVSPADEPIGTMAAASRGEGRRLRTAQLFSLDAAMGLPQDFLKTRFDIAFLPLFRYREGLGANGVFLPPVITEGEWETVRARLGSLVGGEVNYLLISNPSHIRLAKEFSLVPVGDFRLNVANGESVEFYRELGISSCILSAELTLPMLRDLCGGAIVYGRIPLMLTERCFVKETGGCGECGRYSLLDRLGKRFPVLREYPHRSIVFNSLPTYMGDRQGELARAGILHEHFIFSTESAEQIASVMDAYEHGSALPFAVRRVK